MRFTQFLDQNCQPEWSRAYIDYRACTRQINVVAARIKGRELTEDELVHSDEDLDNGPSRCRPRRKEPPPPVPQSGLRRRHGGGSTPHLSLPESVLSLTARGASELAPRSQLRPDSSADGIPPSASATGSSLHPRGGSMWSEGASTDDSPNAHLQVRDPRRAPSLISDGSGNGVEDLRDEGSNSFLATGSVRNQSGTIEDGGLKDVDDIFSPNSKGTTEPSRTETTASHWLSPSRYMLPAKQMLSPFKKSPAGKSPAGKSPAAKSPAPKSPLAQEHVATPHTGKPYPGTPHTKPESRHGSRLSVSSQQCSHARSLEELYDSLYPDEYEFFQILDHELNKVETFYSQRQASCRLRFHELRDQVDQMRAHDEEIQEKWARWEGKMNTFVAATTQMLGINYNPEEHGIDEHGQMVNTPGSKRLNEKSSGTDGSPTGDGHDEDHDDYLEDHMFQRDKFLEYKRSISKAMNEFYRYLEMLKNYRIVNLIGFRKALKKFEVTTRIQCLKVYSEDRISPCTFATGAEIDKLLKMTEELYAQHFCDGDLQAARRKLRLGEKLETFYDTTYRGGFMVGMGLPAAVLAIVKFFDPETRRLVPGYEALMVIYGSLYIPIFFTMLFQLNLDLWVKMRINYEFVMEITRPCLNHHCFHKIPAFLFMTLSYCFFFSFYRVAPNSVAPTTWPIAWLVFVCVFFLNPLPNCRRNSRWWFIRTLGHVVTPGLSSVKFTVFFVADILNSHTYTIQNIYFLGCVSAHGWPRNSFKVCNSGEWPFALLACLAPIARLGQCLRRYWETRLPIHLVNAGKYATSILVACLGVWNRSRGFTHDDRSLAVWCVFAVINSIYTCAWDFIVDWSLCRPGQKGLRPDLAYPSRAFYYAAMVYNFFIRFVWIWALPRSGEVPRLRTWVFALLEAIRRWVWNFFRVETEHLGNADAYRVTRDVPLPYRKIPDDETTMAKRHRGPVGRRLEKIGEKLVGSEAGRGPDALNVGARGRAPEREYEASRPGDDGTMPDMDMGAV